MAGRKGIRGTRPRRLPVTGKGWVECEASGFLRVVGDLVHDVKQGRVRKRVADITPGFGTYHPQDLKALGPLDDPKSIHPASPKDTSNYSKQDLGISDQEIEASIREGRFPRRGY